MSGLISYNPKRLLTDKELDEYIKLEDSKKQKKYLEKLEEQLWEQKLEQKKEQII